MGREGDGEGTATRELGRLYGSGTLVGLSETQLLDRFVLRRDQSAFEALVDRHGPMVLGVCRRALVDPNDVDDAFQATFLVLVRRANGLGDRVVLGAWLHGVARKVSARARSVASKRKSREESWRDDLAARADPEDESTRADLRRAIDDELAALPASDRAAIVLADVEGRPGPEAARALGLNDSAFRSRLQRARARLRDRLGRRGLAPDSAAGVTVCLGLAASRVPEALAGSTILAAIRFATVPASAVALAGPAVALTEGVLRTMTLSHLKPAGVALAAALIASGVGLRAQQPGAAPVPTAAPAPGRPSEPPQAPGSGPTAPSAGPIPLAAPVPGGPAREATAPEAGPEPTGRTADRLDTLERKLDKLIEAMGRQAPPPPSSPESLPPPTAPIPPPPATPDLAPSATPRIAPEPAIPVPTGDDRTTQPDPFQLQPLAIPSAPRPTADEPFDRSPEPALAPLAVESTTYQRSSPGGRDLSSRVERAESRLDGLERRLRALEIAVHGDRRPSGETPSSPSLPSLPAPR